MQLYSSLIAERLGIRRGLFAVTGLSLLTNVFLAGALMTSTPEIRTIIVPPTITGERESWSFDNRSPGAPYLQRWALSVLSYAANLTPDTVDASIARVLAVTAPEHYGELESAFLLEADRIKREHTATAFYPDKAAADAAALTVDVDGTRKIFVGNTVTSSRRARWRLTFRYDAGRLFLTSLTDMPVNR